MADIRSMFQKMSDTGGGGDAGTVNGTTEPAKPPAKKTAKKGTIEDTYQKKTQLEHILLRPDTYIGSVEHVTEQMWIYDVEKESLSQKEISYVPGLYKIFDEILVNAADNKQRDKKMDCIKIEIKPEENFISVWNNGEGIPVVMHQEEKMYVPSMIFGHLLTSSNYNDEEGKVTGGRNGYGAKLCNIFSTKFVVETSSHKYKRSFKQTWGSNMTKASEPKVKDSSGDDYTKISFNPDLAKFKMDKLDNDIVGLLSRRAFDVAASSRGVKVFLNGKRLPIKNFKDYMDLYIKNEDDDLLKGVYESVSERWEVGFCLSTKGFQQISFVNSIATTKGGRHVDYIVDMLVKQMQTVIDKKNKGGIKVKPAQIKPHIWVFINCLIVNPTFDSQTKETMTLQSKNFGSTCKLPEKFINSVLKCGIVESVLSWAKFKAQTALERKDGKKSKKLKGIPKLEDANEAGSKNSNRCTLILTEGDSAKAVAVAGLGVIGRDYYGVFPLRGKVLNVREATHKQILENAEINNLIKILGLKYKFKYNTEEDMKTLRYGKIMIMTDQDQDGSHIKGLLINFIHYNWPELIKQDFIEEFITPIVKVRKRNTVMSFYSLPEFEEWKNATPDYLTYRVKYYKGLGTSDSNEAREYFRNMARHRIRFKYGGQQDDDHIVLAFSRKHIEQRKEWLLNFMSESKRRKELGMPDNYLYTKDTKFVSFKDFVNLELVLFSNGDNIRSIPSLVDGFKPGQRKILFTCIKRNDKNEVKVAQLSGAVLEAAAYHHGEVSLQMAIVNLAQNFVGSNNLNLLEPRGQFGTRLSGGKDSASARYIHTRLSPLTRLILNPQDDPLLKHELEDNKKVEPIWYMPIIPMVLVNGADGIGTGWMTKIPNYNPRELVAAVRKLLDDEPLEAIKPWYKNFKGQILECGEGRYVCSGEIALLNNDKLEITELPVHTWTQNYKENVLEVLLHGNEKVKTSYISDFKEYNTDTTVRFVATLTPEQRANAENEGFHKLFKLQTIINTSSMVAFDAMGCLKRVDDVRDIIKEFYDLRLSFYVKRKEYQEGILQAESDRLSDQARFIKEKCDHTLVVENKKRDTIIAELVKKGFRPDPVLAWKAEVDAKAAEEEEAEALAPSQDDDEDNDVDDEAQETASKPKKPAAPLTTDRAKLVRKFDYLLGLSMWMLTEERKNELLRQSQAKLAELEVVKSKSAKDMWREDLDVFLAKLDQVEAKERLAESGSVPKVEKGKRGQKGRKSHYETLPADDSERIEPVISEEIKKKIQTAVKQKESKGRGRTAKKEVLDEGAEGDEFDAMVKGKKTLKDKLGTPEEAEKKGKRGRKVNDGLKQTKLNFPVKSPTKENGKKRGRKKITSSSEEEELSDIEDASFERDVSVEALDRSATRRNARKPVKYTLDDSDFSENEDNDLHDNVGVTESGPVSAAIGASDSDEPEAPPPAVESSEDMFDSLVGRTKSADSSDDTPLIHAKTPPPLSPIEKPKKKAPVKRKRAQKASDSEDGPKKTSKKTAADSDEDFEAKKPKGKRAPKKKKTANSDDESDGDFVVKPRVGGRAKKPAAYALIDSSDESD